MQRFDPKHGVSFFLLREGEIRLHGDGGSGLPAVFYSRSSPCPNTTYFSEVRPSRPTGPRACSLSLEMPISAPRPNSKPSAKRVDAFTITDAESTSRKKRNASL